jgi:hypothetical protein
LLELGREAGDVKQQIQLNFGLPLNWRTLLKNLNPVYRPASTDDAASFHCGGNLETPAEHYPDELS